MKNVFLFAVFLLSVSGQAADGRPEQCYALKSKDKVNQCLKLFLGDSSTCDSDNCLAIRNERKSQKDGVFNDDGTKPKKASDVMVE